MGPQRAVASREHTNTRLSSYRVVSSKCALQIETSLILYSTVTGLPASRMKRPEPTKTLFSRTLSSGWPVSNLTCVTGCTHAHARIC